MEISTGGQKYQNYHVWKIIFLSFYLNPPLNFLVNVIIDLLKIQATERDLIQRQTEVRGITTSKEKKKD